MRNEGNWGLRLWRGLFNAKIGKVIPIVIILIVWEVGVRLFQIPPYFLPSVSSIIIRLVELLFSGELLIHTFYTIYRSLLGIFFGTVAGVLIGFMMAWYWYVDRGLDFIIAATYPLPKVALIPLLMVWLGLGEAPKLAMSVVGVIYPVIINTVVGVKNIDPLLIKAARDLGATDQQLFREVILPGSLPTIFAGLKLGAGVSFILVVASEMVFGNNGLGYIIAEAASIMHLDTVFAGLMELCIIGIGIFLLVDFLERVAIPWDTKTNKVH